MKIITISREFGSGGRELGKRLADTLGFAYYDREIISAIAEKYGLDEAYVENALDQPVVQSIPLNFRRTFSLPNVQARVQVNLLLEQKRVLDEIAKAGKDCIIVGRNANVILYKYHPLNLFVCADMESKLRRCEQRAPQGEHLSRRQMERKIREVDKNRARSREFVSGTKWGDPKEYHLVINTTGWEIKNLTPVIAEFARCWFEKTNEP